MNRKLVHTLFLMLLMAMITLSASVARADSLTVTFTNPNQIGNAGETLSFFGTISTAGNTGTVYINGDALNPTGPITGDDTAFLDPVNGAPLFMAPGDTFNGLLFTLKIGSNAPAYFTYPGTFQILGDTAGLGGYDPVSNAAAFTVTVVPEPASMLLLGSGLSGLVGVIRRKRQS